MQNRRYKYELDDYVEPKTVVKYKSDIRNELTFEQLESEVLKLVGSDIDNKSILGYVTISKESVDVYCKYNKRTELFVTYTYENSERVVKSHKFKSWREFTGDKGFEYCDEISKGM